MKQAGKCRRCDEPVAHDPKMPNVRIHVNGGAILCARKVRR